MQTFIGVLASLIFLVGGGFIVWGLFAFLRALVRGPGARQHPGPSDARDEIDGMNDGDYYNGPGGYHATGGYENSFYGQIYDGDEEDEHQ